MYKKLETVKPDVPSFFTDLYSTTQVGQEYQNFDHLFDPDVLIMTTGTEMTWQVIGGTNFWQDYSDKYSVKWTVEPRENSNSQDCLKIAIDSEQVTKFDISVRCKPTSDQVSDLDRVNKLVLTMHQSSKQSRHLMRPA